MSLGAIWPFVTVLVLLRGLAVFGGTRLGARLAGAEETVRAHAWTGLVSQAGVTLGMVVIAVRAFPEWGAELTTLFVAMVAIHELVGPVLFQHGLKAAGEVGMRDKVEPSSSVDDGAPRRPLGRLGILALLGIPALLMASPGAVPAQSGMPSDSARNPWEERPLLALIQTTSMAWNPTGPVDNGTVGIPTTHGVGHSPGRALRGRGPEDGGALPPRAHDEDGRGGDQEKGVGDRPCSWRKSCAPPE